MPRHDTDTTPPAASTRSQDFNPPLPWKIEAIPCGYRIVAADGKVVTRIDATVHPEQFPDYPTAEQAYDLAKRFVRMRERAEADAKRAAEQKAAARPEPSRSDDRRGEGRDTQRPAGRGNYGGGNRGRTNYGNKGGGAKQYGGRSRSDRG